MFRRIEDFGVAWEYESSATLRLLGACTEAAMSQRVAPSGRTLGRLAWHITITLGEMLGHAGLAVKAPASEGEVPPLATIVSTYAESARAVAEAVQARWTDAMLGERVPMYGEEWARGAVLSSLITHQAHHRGQMTVLMRQAGLRVPGLYGPAAEEWSAMGMSAQP